MGGILFAKRRGRRTIGRVQVETIGGRSFVYGKREEATINWSLLQEEQEGEAIATGNASIEC